MKFDFAQIQFTDIDGNPLVIEGIQKNYANMLFQKALTISVHEASIKINKGYPFDIDSHGIDELIDLTEKMPLYMFAKQPILNYLKSLKNDNTNKHNDETNLQ